MNSFRKIGRFSFLVAALALPLTVPVAAPAAGEPITVIGGLPTISVSYADLNLKSPAGLKALHSRVRGAARRLCMDNNVPLAARWESFACFDEAVAGASGQIELAVAKIGREQFAARQTISVAAR